MAAIKSVDHKGMEFPSFKAMCEHWDKKPATVRKRLKDWGSLELALEIPEIPGYKFKFVFLDQDDNARFEVKINPNYKQHKMYEYDERFKKRLWKYFTLEDIKEIFPKNKKAFDKGRMVGLY